MIWQKRCICGAIWEIDEECDGYNIWLEPWPHYVCPNCGHWIPLF